ncbi:hypothetical protein RJT34_01799 [Clitoria ternatea]|uniref:DUF641 domain-containing protein n=1 Tax=Clitoria ternatea TaxID=43366 RepID=A0AAN9KHF6_CLITE
MLLQMDSVKPSAVTPGKSKLYRKFAKVLHVRVVTGIAPVDGLKNVEVDDNEGNMGRSTINKEELQKGKKATEAFLAKVFASISSLKSSYAQLQYAQSPYDPDGIQASDQLIVSEFKTLSELKQCYFKKQFDPSPDRAILAAELKELQSVLKTFEIIGKKLESHARLMESEIIFLREKLEEANRQNRLIEKSLGQSGSLSILDNRHLSGLSSNHFVTVLRHTVRSIRSFVKLLVNEMRSAGWDIDASVNAINGQDVVFYYKEDHKCFAIESYVCREMFDSFNVPNFSLPNESLPNRNKRQVFFGRFNELKSVTAKDFLADNARAAFAKFCRVKYLRLVHPKMEASIIGNLNHRNLVNAGEFPGTNLFTSFAEMAKRVWLLHCLAFSFEPQASIFQVGKGCRFSDVYMESVNDERMALEMESEPHVAFTVVPGFRIDKTVVQCQVYLSQHNHVKNNSSTCTKQT